MQDNKTELSVSTEVLEKMTEIAALEVDGVVELSRKSLDIKDVIKVKSAFKGVKAEIINGAVHITVYIKVKEDAALKTVALNVQNNVKEKIQTMTGTVVTGVNVIVADVSLKNGLQQEENQ